MVQIALFDAPIEDAPLPERIAKKYGFPLQHEDVDTVRYYVALQWVSGVAQADNPVRLLSDLKRQAKASNFEPYARIVQLPFLAADGKRRKVDYVDAESLYMITQRLRAKTGIRDAVLRYLSKSGVFLDEIMRDPDKATTLAREGYRRKGWDEERIDKRMTGKDKRHQFTDTVQKALADPSPRDYALLTNALYTSLWERTAEQLRDELGLPKSAVLRDYLGTSALAYQGAVEALIAAELGDAHDLTEVQAAKIIQKVAQLVRPMIEAKAREAGVDLATGRKLPD